MTLGICKTCGVGVKPTQKFCDTHRPTKYKNRKVECAGFMFDSKAEADHYQELLLLERAKKITGFNWKCQADVPLALARQQRFRLPPEGEKVCVYVADFVYRELETGKIIVADYKGHKTDYYKLKARLFAACLGFPITEIRRSRKKRIA